MNEQLRPASLPVTTRAADGLLRRRFTVAEIERMVADGIIAEDEHIELIGGEVVPVSPKGPRHEIIRTELAFQLSRQCPVHLRVASEPFLRLAPDVATEPDIMVYPASVKPPAVDGRTALLVIEVSDSSLAYDLNVKASIYAAHGVREYWVINAQTLETQVHREPAAAGYGEVRTHAADARLEPLAAPELAVSLGAFDLD
ncbi:MAG: Uma2 family endonuclease [Bacteroidota bacterium]